VGRRDRGSGLEGIAGKEKKRKGGSLGLERGGPWWGEGVDRFGLFFSFFLFQIHFKQLLKHFFKFKPSPF
jgi:hypothetical protein